MAVAMYMAIAAAEASAGFVGVEVADMMHVLLVQKNSRTLH